MPTDQEISSEQVDDIVYLIELADVECALESIEARIVKEYERNNEAGFVQVVEKYDRIWRQAAERAGVDTDSLKRYLRRKPVLLSSFLVNIAYREIDI